MKRGPPFPFFVLPLEPARERSKVLGMQSRMQSLPVICISFLLDLCPECAGACVCIPGQGTRKGASETLGCGCSAAALGRVRVKVTPK